MKVKNDHRSIFSNSSNWKEEGSNPVEALIFFRLLLSNCLNWKIYCDDHSSLSSTTAVHPSPWSVRIGKKLCPWSLKVRPSACGLGAVLKTSSTVFPIRPSWTANNIYALGFCRYVRPPRVWFFNRFGHKQDIDFGHFGLKMRYGFCTLVLLLVRFF